eukprot:140898_1
MMSSLNFCLYTYILYSAVNSVIPEHEIISLPGWNDTLPSKQYSGMLTVPNTSPARLYHYWLITSENDPINDPIVFWFQGGPGASSMLGYFVELGPFHTNQKSIEINTTSIPVLFYDPYNWSKIANLVFIESPAGTGFSYCNGTDGPIKSCPHWNDTLCAMDNHAILQQFFIFYSEFINNPFYLIGESYAGVFIPTLVMQIESNPNGLPKLLGFAVGNGCTGIGGFGGCNLDESENFWGFMYGHSQVRKQDYEHILDICGNSLHYGNESMECKLIQDEIKKYKLGGYNVWNIYDKCYLENDMVNSGIYSSGFNGAQYIGPNQYECGGQTVLSIYLNMDEVKEAIHVPQWIHWEEGIGPDNNIIWLGYTNSQTDEIPYYKKWVNKYRILIYYGDVDSIVPYNGGEYWTTHLGYEAIENWRPWTTDGKQEMAGYVTIYDTNNTNFTYCTIRGAGHMVPQYKPVEGFNMFKIWLQNLSWPMYSNDYGV